MPLRGWACDPSKYRENAGLPEVLDKPLLYQLSKVFY
jgi:hypothetical protein